MKASELVRILDGKIRDHGDHEVIIDGIGKEVKIEAIYLGNIKVVNCLVQVHVIEIKETI